MLRNITNIRAKTSTGPVGLPPDDEKNYNNIKNYLKIFTKIFKT